MPQKSVSSAVPEPLVARGDAEGAGLQDRRYITLALEQPPREDGDVENLRVLLCYLAVGQRRQYLDELGFGAADKVEAPLDGPRVYGEEPLDGYEPRGFGALYHVPVGGYDPLHAPREEAQAARVGGDPSDQVHVDVDLGPPALRTHPREHLEDVATEHEDRGMIAGERSLQRAVRAPHRGDDRVGPQRQREGLSSLTGRLPHAKDSSTFARVGIRP